MRRDSSAHPSAAASATRQVPEHVQSAISELAADTSIRAIWLIGSQVNGTASASSDWDLLVFSIRDPNVREVRVPGVDVIWKGPTRTLLEGQPEFQQIDFNNFMWNERNDGTAEYVGYKLNEFETGVVYDTATPRALRLTQSAVRIWPTPHRSDRNSPAA